MRESNPHFRSRSKSLHKFVCIGSAGVTRSKALPDESRTCAGSYAGNISSRYDPGMRWFVLMPGIQP